jgi:hypothetical protein
MMIGYLSFSELGFKLIIFKWFVYTQMKKHRIKIKIACRLLFALTFTQVVSAQNASLLRRPISTVSPAWLIHIDVWVRADPMKVIDLIPEDIRPYVIFNLSLSVSDPGTGPYGINVTTPTIVESWLRACAERGVWAVIQPASGYICNLPYTHTANDIYERFYREYPNFLGYNFAEQCWGFPDDASINQRITLFSYLIQLANKYGGYLFVSHTQTMNAEQLNALAILKRSANFRYIAKKYKENYVTLEKYTTGRGFYDVESTSLGAYLSGYCGNYGMRFDDCGWTYLESRKDIPFPESLGAMTILEHFMLTGQTVQDGPELTWTQAIGSDGTQTSTDGYKSKKFKLFDNFINHNLDLFRKQLDGSFRIPSKEEVITRTKVAYINDATSGNNRNKYSSEQSLFTGLYALDGEYDNNKKWTKSTGRYPSIPSIFQQGAYETGTFEKIVKKSTYSATWPTINAKIADMNALFPEEYTGKIYAGRIKNTWITYNPYMGDIIDENTYQVVSSPASGSIPFKYNTCTKMEVSHANYGYAVITEFADSLNVYVNNFCSRQSSVDVPLVRNTEIKIYGSTKQPSYTANYRVNNGSTIPPVNFESTIIVDFESNNVSDTYPMTSANGQSEVVIDPSGASGKVLHIFGPANQTFPKFQIVLPEGRKLGDYQTLKMDFNGGNNSGRYGQGMRMGINDKPLKNYNSAADFGCPDGSWGRGFIALPLADLGLTDAEKELTEFTLTVGSATGSGDYYIDNIAIEREIAANPVADSWVDGVFTLNVNHNGAIDLTIHCAGAAIGKLTDYPARPVMREPAAPPAYTGPRQHEFEDFEHKNIENANAGSNTAELEKYTGMEYSIFGNNPNACMRKSVSTPQAGAYLLKTRYSAPLGNVEGINLYVNGQQTAALAFNKTSAASDWQVLTTTIELEANNNMIEFKATGATGTLYLDNIVIEKLGEPSEANEPNEPGEPGATAAESLLTAALTLYPNPFADELHISGAEGCTLRLINASGATVLLRQLASPSENLNLETLPAGLYFLHFEKDGKSKTLQAVKL